MCLSPTFLVIFLQKILCVHDRIDGFEDQREVVVGDRARIESSSPVIPELDVESANAGAPRATGQPCSPDGTKSGREYRAV